MSIEEARATMKHMASMMDPVQRRHAFTELNAGLRREIDRKARVERAVAALAEIQEWDDRNSDIGFVLEKNDCSRIHHLREAAADERLLDIDASSQDPLLAVRNIDHFQQSFVVRHNWADAFSGAEGIEDCRMPYDQCGFEFRVSGRSIIVLCIQLEGFPTKRAMFVESQGHWLHSFPSPNASPFITMIDDNIRAICIALDAEVATSEVVRAPVKLNEKRAKAGKTPLPDYRVVDLSRRHRIANPGASSAGTGTRKRLHFRRGHWRHYESTKTWVKWCLVGNPDLGFINKHYRL